jgi:hypothetical protein
MSLFDDKELAAAGQMITAIVLDSNVVLKVGDDREHEFRIENDITVSTDNEDVVVHYDPYSHERTSPRHITELASIVGARLSHASAYNDGTLVLVVDHEHVHSMTVEPKARYEAWTYTYGNYILSCPPGGRLSRP